MPPTASAHVEEVIFVIWLSLMLKQWWDKIRRASSLRITAGSWLTMERERISNVELLDDVLVRAECVCDNETPLTDGMGLDDLPWVDDVFSHPCFLPKQRMQHAKEAEADEAVKTENLDDQHVTQLLSFILTQEDPGTPEKKAITHHTAAREKGADPATWRNHDEVVHATASASGSPHEGKLGDEKKNSAYVEWPKNRKLMRSLTCCKTCLLHTPSPARSLPRGLWSGTLWSSTESCWQRFFVTPTGTPSNKVLSSEVSACNKSTSSTWPKRRCTWDVTGCGAWSRNCAQAKNQEGASQQWSFVVSGRAPNTHPRATTSTCDPQLCPCAFSCWSNSKDAAGLTKGFPNHVRRDCDRSRGRGGDGADEGERAGEIEGNKATAGACRSGADQCVHRSFAKHGAVVVIRGIYVASHPIMKRRVSRVSWLSGIDQLRYEVFRFSRKWMMTYSILFSISFFCFQKWVSVIRWDSDHISLDVSSIDSLTRKFLLDVTSAVSVFRSVLHEDWELSTCCRRYSLICIDDNCVLNDELKSEKTLSDLNIVISVSINIKDVLLLATKPCRRHYFPSLYP